MLKSLFNWKVFLNLIIAIVFFLGLVWLTFRWLEFHTHHGKEVEVPNVMNKSVHDAIKILDDSGLDYEVDSINNSIVFYVKDSGIGMPEEFKEKIFKRFNKINAKNIS